MSTAFSEAVNRANLQTIDWQTGPWEMALHTIKQAAAGIDGLETTWASVEAKSPELNVSGYSRKAVNLTVVKVGLRSDIRIPNVDFGNLGVGGTIQGMSLRRTTDDLPAVFLDISGSGFNTTGGPVDTNFDNADFTYVVV